MTKRQQRGSSQSQRAFVGAIYAMSLGYDVAGAAVVIASLASLVGTFLYGTKSRRDERVEKSKL